MASGRSIERRRGRHVEHFLAHPTAGGDGAVGEPDDLPVAHAPVRRLAMFRRAILCDWGMRSQGDQSAGQAGARGDAFGVHQDGNVIASVDANVHPPQGNRIVGSPGAACIRLLP